MFAPPILYLKTDENQKKKQIKMLCWRLSLVCNCAQGESLGLSLATITLLATFLISWRFLFVFSFPSATPNILANFIIEVSERCRVENVNLRTPAEIRDFGRST